MNNRKRTFIFAAITVVVTHVILWFTIGFEYSSHQLYIGGLRWHHLYTGLVIYLLSWLLPKRVRPLFQGVGLGLIIDETTLPLYLIGFHQFQYWYWASIVPIVIVVLLYGYFVFKKDLHAQRA